MSVAKAYAGIFGGVYTLVGILGFFVSATLATGTLILFPVNVLHNIAHIALIGVPGLLAYATGRGVAYARAMAVLFAVLVVAGFFPQPFLGIIPLGGWDIALHALSGLAAVAAGWIVTEERQTSAA